jgi:hypothetical protein
MNRTPSAKRIAQRFMQAAPNPHIPSGVVKKASSLVDKLEALRDESLELGKEMNDLFGDIEDQYEDAKKKWVETTGGHPDDFMDSDVGEEWQTAHQIAEELWKTFYKPQGRNVTTALESAFHEVEYYVDWLKSGQRPR